MALPSEMTQPQRLHWESSRTASAGPAQQMELPQRLSDPSMWAHSQDLPAGRRQLDIRACLTGHQHADAA